MWTRFRRGDLRLGRTEAFSDGVFAIVVTLLVLDLKVPSLADARDSKSLANALLALMPQLLSWLISFIIVCKFWLNHHHLLTRARRADYAMLWLNSLFLMGQSFIPFPTALMGQYPHNPLAVTLFGLTMALNTALFLLLQRYILRALLKPEFEGTYGPHWLRKAMLGELGYLLGAALAWINIPAAFLLYMVTPLFFVVPPADYKKTVGLAQQ